MKTTARGIVIASLALLVIGAGVTGCSNDTLQSGSQAVNVRYVPSPSGVGRYERGLLDIQSIQIRPSDPALTPIYGTTPLSLRFTPFVVDMTHTTAETYANVALAAGTYDVTRIVLTSPQLVDTDSLPPAPAPCIVRVSALPSGPASGAVPATFTYTNPASLTFTVRPGQTRLDLMMDIPGVIGAYESAFTCNPDCDGNGNACLTAFDTAAFTAAYLAHITLQ